MRILLIEDDSSAARAIEAMLMAQGLDVTIAALGEEGVDLAKRDEYDAIILDLQLPDMSGFDVLQSLRSAKVNAPLLVLSGNVAVESRVKALRSGADDYMTKPFHRDEMIARVHAVIRRSSIHAQSLIVTGKLVLNLDAKTAEVSGEPMRLTTKEYQLLEALSLRKGTALTKNVLLNQLYDGRDEPGQKIIDVFMCKLRKKLLAATKGENYIKTVWGQGYEMQDPPLAIAS
jgi:two-component system cell cycle response regulator CtrA